MDVGLGYLKSHVYARLLVINNKGLPELLCMSWNLGHNSNSMYGVYFILGVVLFFPNCSSHQITFSLILLAPKIPEITFNSPRTSPYPSASGAQICHPSQTSQFVGPNDIRAWLHLPPFFLYIFLVLVLVLLFKWLAPSGSLNCVVYNYELNNISIFYLRVEVFGFIFGSTSTKA